MPIQMTTEHMAEREAVVARLKGNFATISRNATRTGKTVAQYLTDLGFDPGTVNMLVSQAKQPGVRAKSPAPQTTQVNSESGSTTERPKEPMPENFGLTPARARDLREPVPWDKISENRWFWIGNAVVVAIGAVVAYESTQSFVETGIMLFVGVLPYLFAVLTLTAVGVAAFSSIWRRFQPDYREYTRYTRGVADYRARFNQWLRVQEFWWASLDGRRFEIELAMVLKKLGYDVRRTGGAGDGGVDLALSLEGHEIIVQCKAHKKPIGPGPVRDLYGAMVHRNVPEAWLVSTAGFSSAAKDFAKGKRIRLLRVCELLKADRALDFRQERTP